MPYDSHMGCYYQDPNGLPGYDEWKLRSPYDDYEEPEECRHEEYSIDWEGRAECSHCEETWWPSPAVVKAYFAAERRAQRAWKRHHSWWMKAWRWIAERLPKRRPVMDDEIPF